MIIMDLQLQNSTNNAMLQGHIQICRAVSTEGPIWLPHWWTRMRNLTRMKNLTRMRNFNHIRVGSEVVKSSLNQVDIVNFPSKRAPIYANILVFININPFLYTYNQFALQCSCKFCILLGLFSCLQKNYVTKKCQVKNNSLNANNLNLPLMVPC